MNRINSFYETIDHIITDGVNREILHLYTDDEKLSGNLLKMNGKEIVNFGSCSYLGLEFDERLKASAIRALEQYGTQFSESRAYVSVSLYKKLEEAFERLFGAAAVVTPTTTLGHMAALPVLVGNEDAVIMDHQVHNSVQMAVSLLKARGVHVELLRHNRIDLLKQRALELRGKYKKVWYMADGIYSMFGNKSPVKQIYELMDSIPELWYYVDDAHGMSIYGQHGRGYVLHEGGYFHPRMILATSLAKAFATGGAVLLFPDKELARRVRTCGGTLITSGPLQPATLGAAIASAAIHLSDEIYKMQEELQDNIRYANLILKKRHLPVISTSDAAVFFIGVSLPKIGYAVIKRMLRHGYYLNLGIFPAVPIKNTGIRFTITRLHTFRQIEDMIDLLAEEFGSALREENYSLEQIYRSFKMAGPLENKLDNSYATLINQSLELKVYEYDSILRVDAEKWDRCFAGKGSFDSGGMLLLERTFRDHKEKENNWTFRYLLVEDNNNQVIFATFMTAAIWKDDMLSPKEISAEIEMKRIKNPDHLTSRTVSTGSLITEGEHIYLNKAHPLSKDAFLLFLDRIGAFQESENASKIVLRDFSCIDPAYDSLLIDNGFFRVSMPENNIVESMDWDGEETFCKKLSANSRKHLRKYVLKNRDFYEVEVRDKASREEIRAWYDLYLNVKNKSLTINTFALPLRFFENICQDPAWEVILLKIRDQASPFEQKRTVACVFCCRTSDSYIPVIIGMDYAFNEDFQVYRQALYQIVMRGKQIQANKIYLGFSASIEKQKMGAVQVPTYAYVQAKDNFDFQLLESYRSVKKENVK